MYKRIIAAGLLLAVLGFQAAAQDAEKVIISGDLTTIYTLGNASTEQKIDDSQAVGTYFNDQVLGTRKNGYYTAANLYATLRPFAWLEGYFKIYSISRPGSFHLPLSMENMGARAFDGAGGFTLDAVYGRASVLQALALDIPVEVYLKGGRYKAQANQFGIVSKYRTEQVLYMMNTKTDFTYELGAGLEDKSIIPFRAGFFAATNYLFNESVQRYYDEDGAQPHGDPVLNEYAPQFLFGLRAQEILPDLLKLNVEALYGQNVSGIYSGHAVGFSAGGSVAINDLVAVPYGVQVAFHEKNIDMMGQAAIASMAPAAGNTTTMDFRESLGAALGTGVRLRGLADIVDWDVHVAGAFNHITHYYRNDLDVIKLSLDTMVTIDKKYFVGGGAILGSLAEAEWKTRDDAEGKETYYEHIFKLEENIGLEVYGGINLSPASRFVIGFNENKGISLNHMLEARHEGQMKYKQADTNWAQDKLAAAGGLYFKFFFRF